MGLYGENTPDILIDAIREDWQSVQEGRGHLADGLNMQAARTLVREIERLRSKSDDDRR